MPEIEKIPRAMPAQKYDITIRRDDKLEHRSYSSADIEKNRDFLEKRANERAEIRVRPSDNSYVSLKNAPDESVERLKRDGFEPAWRSERDLAIRIGPISREKNEVLTKHLAKQYGAEPGEFRLPPKFDEIRENPPVRQLDLRERAHGLANVNDQDRDLDIEKTKTTPAYKAGVRDGAAADFEAEKNEANFERLVSAKFENTPSLRRDQAAAELEEIAKEAKLAERYYKQRVAEEVKKLRAQDDERQKAQVAGWREQSLEEKRKKQHSRTLMAWEKQSATLELKPPMSAEEQEAVRAIVANTMSTMDEGQEPEKTEKPAQKEQEISHSHSFEFSREHKS